MHKYSKIKNDIKMKNLILSTIFLAFMSFVMISCSGTKKTSSLTVSHDGNPETGVAKSNTEAKESNLSLADYLRRLPGVRVIGTGDNVRVFVRGGGGSPQASGNSPLFVIDGNQAGNDYSQASNMIDMNDIAYVEVLKDVASTNSYGMLGSNGVILIHSKKKKRQ